MARELGLQERDLPRLLMGTGLAPDILMPGDETRLSGRQQLRIMDNGQRMMDAPEFGLRVGRQLHPSTHGQQEQLKSCDLVLGFLLALIWREGNL